MGTHSSSKPLVGLELNLSVHVIYVEMSVTWRNTEEESSFTKRETQHLSPVLNRCAVGPSLENVPHVFLAFYRAIL